MVTPLWLRFAVRRLFAEKVRSLLVILSIALISSLVLAVLFASEVNVRAFGRMAVVDGDDYPIALRGQGQLLPVNSSGELLRALSTNFDVIAESHASGSINGRPVTVVGVFKSSDSSDKSSRDSVGALPANSIMMSRETRRALGIETGGGISLLLPTGQIPLDVRSGESDLEQLLPLGTVVVSAPVVTIIEDAAWTSILLRPRGGDQGRTILDELSGVRISGLPPLRAETRQQRIDRGTELLGAFRLNINIMLALTLLVGAVMIYNASRISLLRVQREISIARTLGCHRSYCAWLLMGEAIVTGIAGGLVGVSLGQPITKLILSTLLGSTRSVYHVPNDFTELTLFSHVGVYSLALGAAVGISLCGALHAARDAWLSKSFDGQERDSDEIHVGRFSLRVKSILATCVPVVTVLGLRALEVRPTLWGAYAVAAAAIASIFVLSFVSVRVVGHAVCRCTRSISMAALQWTARSLRTESTRQRIAVATLSVCFSLIGALGILVASFRQTIEAWISTRLRADFYLGAQDFKDGGEYFRIPQTTVDAVGTISGVSGVARYAQVETTLNGTRVIVGGADIEINHRHGAYRYVARCVPSTPGVLLSESALVQELSLGCGGSVSLGGSELPVAGVISEFGTQLPLVVLPYELFQRQFPHVGIRSAAVYTAENADTLILKQALESKVARSDVRVIEQGSLKTFILEVFDETFLVTNGIRLVLAVLAITSIVVTVWQGVWERRRELTMGTILGMSIGGLRAAIVLETAFVVVTAMPLGFAGALILAYLLVTYINPLSFGWSLDFSWSLLEMVESGGLIILGCVILVHTISRWLPVVLRRGPEGQEF